MLSAENTKADSPLVALRNHLRHLFKFARGPLHSILPHLTPSALQQHLDAPVAHTAQAMLKAFESRECPH